MKSHNVCVMNHVLLHSNCRVRMLHRRLRESIQESEHPSSTSKEDSQCSIWDDPVFGFVFCVLVTFTDCCCSNSYRKWRKLLMDLIPQIFEGVMVAMYFSPPRVGLTCRSTMTSSKKIGGSPSQKVFENHWFMVCNVIMQLLLIVQLLSLQYMQLLLQLRTASFWWLVLITCTVTCEMIMRLCCQQWSLRRLPRLQVWFSSIQEWCWSIADWWCWEIACVIYYNFNLWLRQTCKIELSCMYCAIIVSCVITISSFSLV